MAEDQGLAVVREGRQDDRIVLEARQGAVVSGIQVMLDEVLRPVVLGDVVEPLAVGLPERPAGPAFGVEELRELLRFKLIFPDLGVLRPPIPLPPPGDPFADEQQGRTIRRE